MGEGYFLGRRQFIWGGRERVYGADGNEGFGFVEEVVRMGFLNSSFLWIFIVGISKHSSVLGFSWEYKRSQSKPTHITSWRHGQIYTEW